VRSIEMMRLDVERRMLGERFTDVEDVINASALPADEESALWRLGWSYVQPDREPNRAEIDQQPTADSGRRRAISPRPVLGGVAVGV
jgi:hypothetical protein